MLRRWLVTLAVTAAATGPIAAQTTSAAESTTVVVTAGTGEVTLPPDWAIVSLSLESREQSAAQAAAANRQRLESLMDTLIRTAGTRDSVRLVGLDISSAYDYERDELIGYDAGARVEVRLRNLDRLALILDAAFATGAMTTRDGVEFKSDRADAAKREALAQAFADARLQAEALAEAAGLKLGPLVQVTTQRGVPGYDGPSLGAISVTATNTSLTPSDVVVRALVQASWRLRDR